MLYHHERNILIFTSHTCFAKHFKYFLLSHVYLLKRKKGYRSEKKLDALIRKLPDPFNSTCKLWCPLKETELFTQRTQSLIQSARKGENHNAANEVVSRCIITSYLAGKRCGLGDACLSVPPGR